MALPRNSPPPTRVVNPIDHQHRVHIGPHDPPALMLSSSNERFSLVGSGKPIRVLAHVHLYPPYHNAGAEWMLHALLRYGQQKRGWEVLVITDQAPERNDEWQGIRVRHDRNIQRLHLEYKNAHAVITHLDVTQKAVALAGKAARPLVHLVHNDMQLAYHKVQRRNCALAIFNSQWISDVVGWDGPSTILYPPTRVEDYRTDPVGEEVTLINLSVAKGALTFFDMVERNPGIQFLGVKGSYGVQEKPKGKFSNLTILENQADVVSQVYARTRVLLMPSHYESWGRTAVEAACSGIPSICAPTPGLKEAAVGAAFVKPEDTGGWTRELRKLMRDPGWTRASEAARKRAEELDAMSEKQLKKTCEMIEGLS